MYNSVEEMEVMINKYFQETPEERLTVTWLALALWFSTRLGLINYEWKEEFVNAVKKAKTMVEHAYELSLRKNGRSWDIFALKNFDWKDKTETDNKNENTWEMTINWKA
jgi:hypothetical protein